ncbi:translocation/assembly module TamB domain-containing protein [Sphingomonas quercus]|uniref:Translocation/assembly module TamB n=1 Tax=Sphingomonas quercus TaxID=2842451 RepID=A0ABS6BKG7_9SPHN|nr:translocation/assembly module TamB [Sphingomonas quercus]MBU3078797.1 translocation/assembly module TamB [Sphingomonas quercus]
MARRILKWGGIAVGSLALLVLAVVLGLNTSPGRRFVADQINGYETQSGLKLTVGRIEGSLYGRMTLRSVALRDPRGIFLTAPAINLDWRPFAYLHNKVDVRALWAGQMTLLRVPETKTVPTDPNAPLLPDIDIVVGRLAIDQFDIAPAVTGRRHSLRMLGSADIADGRARITADAFARKAPGLAGGDRLTLMLDAVPEQNRLVISTKLDAPAGGLVDSYAALGKPLGLSINGTGDWSSWRGQLHATAGGDELAALAVTGRNGVFTVKGPLTAGSLLSGPAARLAQPNVDLDLTAALADRKVDLTAAARSGAATVSARGLVDLGASRFGNLRLVAKLLRPGAIADEARGRDVTLDAVLDGPMATPTIDYTLRAAALGFGATGLEEVTARGRATIDADRILIPVSMTARRVTGLNAAAGGLLTNVRADGHLAWSAGRLLSDDLKLRSDRIDATAILIADIAHGKYTGALKGRVNDYQVDGLGRINLVTDARLVTGPRGGFGIRGHVRAVTRRLDDASVQGFLGGQAVTTAIVGYDENGRVTVERLRLDAPQFRVTQGQGSYRLSDGRIAFSAQAVSKQYGPLAVVARGTVARPLVTLKAARPGVGLGLRDLEAELRGVPSGYAVNARGQSDYGPFTTALTIGTGTPLAIDIANVHVAGIDLKGRLTQLPAGPFAGTVTIAGPGLTGAVGLSAEGRYQRADADLRANGASIPGQPPITIERGAIRGTMVLNDTGPTVSGDVALTNVRREGNLLSRLRARLRWQDGRGNVAFAGRGVSGVPFTLAGQAEMTPELVRANLRGSANDVAFRLAAPVEVRKTGEDWRMAPATIVLPQGQVRIEGSYGARTTAKAVLDNLDLSLSQAFAPGLRLGGKASGSIDYAAQGDAAPQMTARLTLKGITRSGIATVSAPVDMAVLATLGEGGADLRAVARRGGGVVGRVLARLGPVAPGEAPWSERLMAAPLSGGIRYNGPSELLWSLTGVAGQTVAGPIAVAADFAGRLDQPQLNGVIRADSLRYENEAYGTTLTNLALRGRFTQSRLEVSSLTAKAGEGSIAARGNIGLDAASGFPMDINATLNRAQLARSDALGGTVSGTLSVTSRRGTTALIKGDLNIPEARYQIIRQGAAEVPELTGVHRKGVEPVAEEASSLPSRWRLDIRVRADNQLFVTGMGLESEWKSNLQVTGTSDDPRLVGQLEVIRGTYSFAGRRFDLTRGIIRFEGGPMTDPLLDIEANTTVNSNASSITATIVIGGHALAPQITLTSTPALPQDEIMARLLFGGPVTSLSPTQAIQLAAALNSLRGTGGGLNPLGKLRSATGIDRLRVLGEDKTAGRGTALAAGQYLTNNIYVEVITDARGYTATQLEIALSRALSILSQTASFGGSSVNLRYRKDY